MTNAVFADDEAVDEPGDGGGKFPVMLQISVCTASTVAGAPSTAALSLAPGESLWLTGAAAQLVRCCEQ
jgi:hypothetical protein